jgi:DNA invertase Pin-like site-specific DNA recombinase
MRIGYKRVSTLDQKTTRQLDGVQVDKLFEDHASGKDCTRPALIELLEFARTEDIVIVHSMDRLARNLMDLRKIVDQLTAKKVSVQFVKENLVFTGNGSDSPMALLMLNLLGAVAEFERSLIRERQREGITLAKMAGKYRGRKPVLNESDLIVVRGKIIAGVPVTRIARELGVSRQTVYSYLKQNQGDREESGKLTAG